MRASPGRPCNGTSRGMTGSCVAPGEAWRGGKRWAD